MRNFTRARATAINNGATFEVADNEKQNHKLVHEYDPDYHVVVKCSFPIFGHFTWKKCSTMIFLVCSLMRVKGCCQKCEA